MAPKGRLRVFQPLRWICVGHNAHDKKKGMTRVMPKSLWSKYAQVSA